MFSKRFLIVVNVVVVVLDYWCCVLRLYSTQKQDDFYAVKTVTLVCCFVDLNYFLYHICGCQCSFVCIIGCCFVLFCLLNGLCCCVKGLGYLHLRHCRFVNLVYFCFLFLKIKLDRHSKLLTRSDHYSIFFLYPCRTLCHQIWRLKSLHADFQGAHVDFGVILKLLCLKDHWIWLPSWLVILFRCRNVEASSLLIDYESISFS